VKAASVFPGSVADTAWNEAGHRAVEAFKGIYSKIEVAWIKEFMTSSNIVNY